MVVWGIGHPDGNADSEVQNADFEVQFVQSEFKFNHAEIISPQLRETSISVHWVFCQMRMYHFTSAIVTVCKCLGQDSRQQSRVHRICWDMEDMTPWHAFYRNEKAQLRRASKRMAEYPWLTTLRMLRNWKLFDPTFRGQAPEPPFFIWHFFIGGKPPNPQNANTLPSENIGLGG